MPSKRKQAQLEKKAAKQERKKSKKKIILFLVEGPSDKDALEIPIGDLCDEVNENIESFFRFLVDYDWKNKEENVGGDITSAYWAKPSNIESKINEKFITPFLNETGLYAKDISQIIQLVDLDGAFIPDSSVVECDEEDASVIYCDSEIRAKNPAGIKERNARKSENLRYLCSLDSIKAGSKTVPYSVYFMSSNLDHYLHGNANLPSNKKVLLASEFSDKCDMTPSYFYEVIQGDFSMNGLSYEESWNFVQDGTESLKKHTNLGLCIDLLSESK